MTTVDTAAARRARSPFALSGIAFLIAFGLAGCETGSNLLGSSSSPSPTAVAEPSPTAAPQAAQAKIAIAPIIGAPDAVAKQIHAQLGTAVATRRITVATQPGDKADYTLRGYVVSAREKTGVKVSYIWDVTDPAGKRVNRITGEEVVANAGGKDAWAAVTPQVVKSIADKTSTSLATWLPTQKNAAVASAAAGTTPPPVQTAAVPADAAAPAGPTTGSIGKEGNLSAIVPSVTGAPGDGSVALTSALQRELSRSGVSLATATGGQTFKVEGKVTVGEAKDGKQPITIDWHVKDPQGKKLGTVSQKNEIPQGSLDGAWGKTADAAAAAAAQGILKLLPQPKAVN